MVNNLRSIRRKRHLSQKKLAQESGVHRVTIAKYETGRTEMSLKNLLKIAVVLGVSVDELISAGDGSKVCTLKEQKCAFGISGE